MTEINHLTELLTKASAKYHTEEEAWPWPITDLVNDANINKVDEMGEVYNLDRDALLKYLPKHEQVDTSDYVIVTSGKFKGKVFHKKGAIQYDFGNGLTLSSVNEKEKAASISSDKEKKLSGKTLDEAIQKDMENNSGALERLLDVSALPKPSSRTGFIGMRPPLDANSASLFEYKRTPEGYEITGFKNREDIRSKYNDIILHVPESYNGLPIVSVGEGAFENNKIIEVFLSKNIREVKDYGFASNNIRKLSLGTGIQSIGKGAFTDNKLAELSLPNQVDVIGSYSFSDNKLNTIKLPDNIETIENYSFANNKIARVDLPQTVVTIGPSAFAFNRISHVNLPSGMISIGKSAFEGNILTSLSVPKTIQLIFESAFEHNGPDSNSGDLVGTRYSGVWHVEDNQWVKLH